MQRSRQRLHDKCGLQFYSTGKGYCQLLIFLYITDKYYFVTFTQKLEAYRSEFQPTSNSELAPRAFGITDLKVLGPNSYSEVLSKSTSDRTYLKTNPFMVQISIRQRQKLEICHVPITETPSPYSAVFHLPHSLKAAATRKLNPTVQRPSKRV